VTFAYRRMPNSRNPDINGKMLMDAAPMRQHQSLTKAVLESRHRMNHTNSDTVVRWSLREFSFASALAVLIMATAGCNRTSGPAEVAEPVTLTAKPARLSLIAGASGKLVARAQDASGNPIDGARLRFGASDPRLLRVTSSGEVTSLGPAGLTSIVMTSGSRSLSVPVDIVAGPAHRFDAVEDSERAMVAGMPSSVSVRLLDAFDNTVANSGVMAEAATEPPISLSTATDKTGVATFALPALTESGHFFLNVHAPGTPQVSLPLDMRVEAAAPTKLEAVKMLPSGPVALVADFELVLRVRDAFGNPVPNVSVRWRTDSGSKSFDPQQSVSGPDGLVRTRWELAGLKRRRANLRAFVVQNEKIRFETSIALER
jgi:hypothetical protein